MCSRLLKNGGAPPSAYWQPALQQQGRWSHALPPDRQQQPLTLSASKPRASLRAPIGSQPRTSGAAGLTPCHALASWSRCYGAITASVNCFPCCVIPAMSYASIIQHSDTDDLRCVVTRVYLTTQDRCSSLCLHSLHDLRWLITIKLSRICRYTTQNHFQEFVPIQCS